MNSKIWKILVAILAVLFVVVTVFLILFGLKISNYNIQKAADLKTSLENQEKELLKTFQKEKEQITTHYVADEVFGSFEFSYPKVWSTNVFLDEGSSEEFIFLADPKLIQPKRGTKTVTALKIKLLNEKYTSQLKKAEDKAKLSKNTKLDESDVIVSDAKGKKFVGVTDESDGRQITFMILPLRDKTLYIATDDLASFSDQYQKIVDSFKLSK